jgi:cytochrome c
MARVLFLAVIMAASSPLHAQTPTPSSLDQRVADLEAYVNNAARTGAGSNISGPRYLRK